jgi:hypothetical protein
MVQQKISYLIEQGTDCLTIKWARLVPCLAVLLELRPVSPGGNPSRGRHGG